jgi:hypothetical protein
VPAAAQGPAAQGPKEPAEPPQGTPAGNNWEAASKGWDLGVGRDEPTTQALPIRNGNGSAATNGSAAASGTDAPSTQPTPGAPSRLPSFTGLNTSGQNVHGSDGPSAPDTVSGLPGGPLGGQGNDLSTGDAAARGTDPGQVTIPPAAAHDQRLPIFDSLESDWFRRSGKTLTTTARTPGPQQGTKGTKGTQAVQEPEEAPGSQGTAPGTPSGQPAAQPSWTSPADEGWHAAQLVASPAAGEMTSAGLPRRVPRANLVPGSVNGGGGQEPEAGAPARSADAARSRMASFQRGVREGRAAAPQQVEEP